MAKERKWWYEPSMFEGEKIKCAKLAQADVMQGGWSYSRSWLTNKAIDDAEGRWAKRSYEHRAEKQGIILRKYGDTNEWSAWQCGGCKFFAALGSDFGICWNEKSPLDGCITFEHGGCVHHSELIQVWDEFEWDEEEEK